MFLTKLQFELLSTIEASHTQKSLSCKNKKAFEELLDVGLVRGNKITDLGLEHLEPYRVQRAAILAAGIGSRLHPLTLHTPKPLIVINGMRIIDTLLEAIYCAGIREIYIVRGYLAEKFDILLEKYPSIQFIENYKYETENNISSAVRICKHLKRSYVMDADLVLRNRRLITKYQYQSNYLGIPVEQTDDWCFMTDNEKITNIALGGRDCFLWIGLSYWTEIDGSRLANDITQVYQSDYGTSLYWDQVPLEVCKDHYSVMVRPCSRSDIVEIDNYEEYLHITAY
ncbi:hypothetical protein AGMMS49992_28030 [Clostridia bacterium]|nr:hypothetical protein AGMMS49992_28030 [Clostridia bacterium]